MALTKYIFIGIIILIIIYVFVIYSKTKIERKSVKHRYEISLDDINKHGQSILTKHIYDSWSGPNPLKITLFEDGAIIYYHNDKETREMKLNKNDKKREIQKDFVKIISLKEKIIKENPYCYDKSDDKLYGTYYLYFYDVDTEYASYGNCKIADTESYTQFNNILKKY